MRKTGFSRIYSRKPLVRGTFASLKINVSTADTGLLSVATLAFVNHGVEQLTGISLDVSLYDVVPHIHII